MRNPSPFARAALALSIGDHIKDRPPTDWERQQLAEAPVDILLGMSLVRVRNERQESCRECFSWPCLCSILRRA